MSKPIETWKTEIAATLGRPLSETENEYLDCLTDILENLEWRDSLYPKDLASLSDQILIKVKDQQTVLNQGIWIETPENEYSLWQYIALILSNHEIERPEFLEKHTDLVTIRQEILDREQLKETRLWKNRLGNLSQRRSDTSNQKLDVRLRLKGKHLVWEASAAGKDAFTQLPAKDLTQWISKDYGFLNRFSSSGLPLCALFQEYYRSTQRARLDLDKPEDCSFFNILIHNPDTNRLIIGRAEEPLSISERKLKWVGVESGASDDNLYSLRLGFSQEEPAPLPIAYLPGTTPLYLHGETLYRGPNLLKPDANANQTFLIPALALESPEGLLFLRNNGLPLPESLKGQIVAIPLTPAFYCRVQESETQFKKSSLQMHSRLVAVSRDQLHWFQLTSEGWEPSDNLETKEECQEPEAGALFEYPDAQQYLELLEQIDVTEEEPGEWNKEITHSFPETFSLWLKSLPEELQIVADEELDSLIDGKAAGRYALQIEEQPEHDWFDIRLTPEMLDTNLTEAEIALLLKSSGEYVRLPGKGWKRFEPEVSLQNQEILNTIGLSFNDAANEPHTMHALQLAEAKLEGSDFDEKAKLIKRRAKSITNQTPVNLPKGIVTDLRPYQEEGFKFLAFLTRNQFGGILADDMGLGKTLQCLTWLTWLKLRLPPEQKFSTLVVCPKSVMHVWKKEVERHSKLLSIATYDPALIHKATWEAADVDILIANYSQLRIHRSFFTGCSWTASVLDEGQYIKNPQSQTSKTARSLKADHRLVLTGTPVENKALDLWSLFAYAMPGLLGSQASFKKHYKETDNSSTTRLSNRVRHFMLRRKKSQVAPDLPARIEETLSCKLEGEQRDLYMAELKAAQQNLLEIDSSGDFNKQRFNVLASLLRLRQICCHPRLVDDSYADIKSAKLEALRDHVAELNAEGHKVLIFSQFVEMLGIVKESLDELDCPNMMLTGKTQNREELVDQFENDDKPTAFLLSLRAAGFGLNLTSASYVMLYDPWWNPAVEAQAIDRTHRIGQKNTVNAYRLIAEGTVEDKIQKLKLQKAALANDIVREDSLNQILDLDNLRYVLSE